MFPPQELTLAEGEQTRLELATPSGTTLRAAACPGITLPQGKGAVVGDVTDADNDKPGRRSACRHPVDRADVGPADAPHRDGAARGSRDHGLVGPLPLLRGAHERCARVGSADGQSCRRRRRRGGGRLPRRGQARAVVQRRRITQPCRHRGGGRRFGGKPSRSLAPRRSPAPCARRRATPWQERGYVWSTPPLSS